MSQADGSRRTRRYIYGGLLAAAGVAVALALIFTVGGVGQKKASVESSSASGVSSLADDKATSPTSSGAGLSDVLDSLKNTAKGSESAATPPASTGTTTTTPVSTTKQNTFTQGDADSFAKALNSKTLAAGDPLQAAALVKGGAESLKNSVGENACWPTDADELTDAVQNQACPLVILTNGDPDAYTLTADIQVTRAVRIMGNPSVLPVIAAGGTVRAFTVGAGGFLEAQFIRIRQGAGITRDRYGLEGLGLSSQVVEIRGGAVAFEVGSLGGTFVGCIFLSVANTVASVQAAITSTMNFVGGRVYGGHIFVAAGTVSFFGCHFWDTVLLIPLTDQVSIGGDVLVVAGSAFFTGCTFTATALVGNIGGLGFNVGVLGGQAIFTFVIIQAQGALSSISGPGQVVFVGDGLTIITGGLMVITGMDFRYATAALNFIGVGDFFCGGGAMIITGLTIENAYPLLFAAGAGFYTAVGAGIMTQVGVTYTQFYGPNALPLTGASVFVGTGSSINVGVPGNFYSTTGVFWGQGGFSFNGAGYSLWLGCPLATFAATIAFFGTGVVSALDAGFLVWIGNPVFSAAGLSYFAGAGGVVFVGAGAAVIGASPVSAPAGIFYANAAGDGANFWIQGTTNSTGKEFSFDAGKGVFVTKDNAELWKNGTLTKVEKSHTDWTEKHHGKVRNLISEATSVSLKNPAKEEGVTHRKLSVSSIQDLDLFGDVSAYGAGKLLAVGVDVNKNLDILNAKVEKSFQSWVPQNILDASKDIANMMKSVSPALRRKLAVPVPGGNQNANIYIAGEDLEYCGICETDGITGPGAASCDITASCDDLKAIAPAGTEAAFDWSQLQFDPTHLVLADFKPTTPDGVAVDPMDFRDGLKAFFAANETTGVHVAAYSAEPDALFKDMMPALPGSVLASPEYPSTTQLKAIFYFTDPAKADALKSALTDAESEDYQFMELFMQDHLSLSGVDMNNLDGAFTKAINIPAYGSKEFTQAFADQSNQAAGSNSVRLVDPSAESVPLDTVKAGDALSVKLGNFPSTSALSVQLIGSQEVDGVAKQTASAIKTVTAVDKNGNGKFAWTVPVDQPAGDYYLKATDATGQIFGVSPTFSVTPAGRIRKLYGPTMEW